MTTSAISTRENQGSASSHDASSASHLSIGLEIQGESVPDHVVGISQSNGYQFAILSILRPSALVADIHSNHLVGHPFAPEDLIISDADWSSCLVGRVSIPPELDSSELDSRRRAELLVQQQVAWTTHLSLSAVTFPFICRKNKGEVLNLNYPRLVNSLVGSLSWSQAWMTIPVHCDGVEDTWCVWNTFHTLSDYHSKLTVLLELTYDLPDDESLNRWIAEPISAVRIPTSVFRTNNKQYPVLGKRHQDFLRKLMMNNVQIVISMHSEQSLHPAGGLAAYQQYLHYLCRSAPRTDVDQFAKGYHDYLQAPLQPLMDNLESQTYAVFEKDPVKYREYENAIREALLDRMETEAKIIVMVVGAGRGPLVSRALAAAKSAGRHVHVYALEKNPNAIVILRQKERNEWNGQVTVVYGDMRYWNPPEKADILVSELLGSFGDNELSPECLDGAQRLLKDDGISIPSDYTAFISPLQSSKLHNEVSAYKSSSHIETPYVVKFRAVNELADSQELWSFTHPNKGVLHIQPDSPTFNSHNTRYASVHFKITKTALIHGIAGYFETTLYKSVKLSIRPQTYSAGMLSWFPIFFPLKTPVLLRENTFVEIHMWRMTDTQSVWYEWTIRPNITDDLTSKERITSSPLYIPQLTGHHNLTRQMALALIITALVLQICAADVHPFTAEDLLSLNYVSSLTTNEAATFAAFTVSHYDISTNEKVTHISLLDLTSTKVVTNLTLANKTSVSSPFFLSDKWLGFLSEGQLYYTDIQNAGNNEGQERDLTSEMLKGVEIGNVKYFNEVLIFSAQAYKNDGRLVRKNDTMPNDSGVVYDKLMIRHWDTYLDPSKLTQLFAVKVDVSQNAVHFASDPINLLANTLLESPVAPFGGSNDFDISPDGTELAFTAKVPGRDEAWNTNTDVYIVPVDADSMRNNHVISISAKNLGSDHSPVYSRDGKSIAWLQMSTPQYESDLNKIALYDRHSQKWKRITSNWDRSVGSMIWSPDSKSLYCTVEEYGHAKIFRVDNANGDIASVYDRHMSSGLNYIADEQNGDKLLFAMSSAVAPNEIFSIPIASSLDKLDRIEQPTQLTTINYDALSRVLLSEPESVTFKGYKDVNVSGWLFKPPLFNPSSSYPVAFLIHGGPEGSWEDGWSQRWNYQIFTSQGFVVLAINPRGSTGYGLAFQRDILKSWGLAPYEDLMKGLDWALKTYAFLDPSRVVALGASFGGYMINWINGHTDRFRALVCHDGIFDTRTAYYTTEELWFPEYEFGGPEYEKQSVYEKWNPAKFVTNWKTPTLVVHSEHDYRLTMSEGIGAFTALQRRRIPSKLLYFPDENHWVTKPANSLRWYKEVTDWILYWVNNKNFQGCRGQNGAHNVQNEGSKLIVQN